MQGLILESVANHGTKRIRTSHRSLLSDALEDICHTIFLTNICGSFEVTMCTGTLFYIMSHQLEILGRRCVMNKPLRGQPYTGRSDFSGMGGYI